MGSSSAPLAELVLLRHGESAENVARDRALANDALSIDIAGRDCDVPLSALGERQAGALGGALQRCSAAPDIVLVSPYVRTRQTATLLLAGANRTVPVVADERLRERESGVLDRLTRRGIEAAYPDEVRSHDRLGKFYYRPPGGESWVDVILRLRSLWDAMRRDYAGRRVLLVTHNVVVLCMRYIVEGLDEEQLLAIDRAGDVANCGLTRYVADGDALRLAIYNSVTPPQAEPGAAAQT
jgi:probable phosphoglycerate mutase